VEKFAQGFAVPGHKLRKKERRNSRVTFGKIKTSADAPAFFATDQDILLQHQFADVFEANGNFVKLAVEFGCELVD